MSRNQTVSFKTDGQVATALSSIAEAEGVSVSEVVRQAVEERLARSTSAERIEEGFNPFATLGPAARGNLPAQREFANECVKAAFQQDKDGKFLSDPVRCLHEGLVFARLAAAHGHVADQGLVISMIALLCEITGEDECGADLAEAIARIEEAANQGGPGAEMADRLLPSLIDGVSADVAAMAKFQREQMKA